MKVLVVDDNPVMRAGLGAMLRTIEEVSEVVEAGDGRRALEILSATVPPVDLVFLDERMPGMDGVAVLEHIPDVPVVMLTNADDAPTIRRAVAAGAKGYLVYGEFGEAELVAALHLCRTGGTVFGPTAAAAQSVGTPAVRYGFTERERSLVEALCEGLSNQQIAHRLFLSEKTVKNNLNRMYAKMGVRSRSEAIITWLHG